MCVNFCSFSFFISEGGQGEIFAGKASNVPSLCAGKWPSKRGYENAMRLYRRRAIDRSKCHMRFRCFRERACICVSVCLCMCTLTQHQGGAVMNFVLFAFFFFSLLFNRQPFQLLCCPSFRLFLIDAASQFFSCYPIRAQFGLFNPLRVFLERYTEQRASTL